MRNFIDSCLNLDFYNSKKYFVLHLPFNELISEHLLQSECHPNKITRVSEQL